MKQADIARSAEQNFIHFFIDTLVLLRTIDIHALNMTLLMSLLL